MKHLGEISGLLILTDNFTFSIFKKQAFLTEKGTFKKILFLKIKLAMRKLILYVK